ncbi:MAG: tRNA(His)-5-guanylyltransferase [Bacteroidetes bacterium]|jgi:tRNA(His) 5'-end guanylyltransferase|nr:tRNA(His)-5-guanylyltransferase [Bacteroidota bacterium]
MKFDELDAKMRHYETFHDVSVLPEMYMVARIDGRSFTKLTKEKHDFNAPFDERFRDYMIDTTKHLMNCGFKITYGFTQSDEISLLFDFNEISFGRKHRKYNSVLAGEASAKFSTLLGDVGAFDCRLCEFPNYNLVVDYFRWRNEDAHRNSLNAHCYWTLRKDGVSASAATKRIEKLTTSEKNELLFKYGTNFNTLPSWQKRGIGIYWKDFEKEGYNPQSKKSVVVKRRQLETDFDLPMKDAYNDFILKLLQKD